MIEIGGYDDFEVIGRGGFATVYRATQISVGRQVAIKVLSDPAPDADLVRRFERESKAVGALSWHPHIAAVVDAGTTDDGRAFIVFELLQGGSLEDTLDTAPMEWPKAIAAMIQVADAIEAAHRADVLHRDIKPANILLNRLGVAKLADFGIASMQDGTKTETGMLATTVAHAAPELFDGAPASESTDIYAMGSTLFNLVMGHPPFVPTDGQRIATIIKAIATQPPPVPDPSRVPTSVANVIAHALAKQPEYRPRSAAAFGKGLQEVQRQAGLAVTPMPISDTEPDPAAHTIVAPPPAQASAPATGWQDHGPASGSQPAVPRGLAGAAPSPAGYDPRQSDPYAYPAQPDPRQSDPYAYPAQPDPRQSDPYAYPAQPDPRVSGGYAYDPRQSDPRVSGGYAYDPRQSDPYAYPVQQPRRRRGLSRLLGALSVLLVLGAAGVGGALAWQARRGPDVLHITAGGARIVDISVLRDTELDDFPGEAAVDGRDDTYWGIAANVDAQRNIAGTTYVIKLAEPVQISQVGISNGTATRFGRVSQISWGTSVSDFNAGAGTNVVQDVPDEPGNQLVPFGLETDQIALAILDVHDDDAPDAGIAEILIVVDDSE